MYNDERNKTLSELRKRTLFRRFAFILLFVILAGSLAGVGSLLFSNSSITDEAGRGEAEVEVAAITGSGTSASPWIITTKADLQAWAGDSTKWGAGTYTEFAADIDWGGSGGGNYPRVTNFAGTFDGKNHVVKNLYMSYSVQGVGFISSAAAGATVKNFGVASGRIINNPGTWSATGGIIGWLLGTNITISDCFNGAEINGQWHQGGIAGTGYPNTNTGTIIKNCFNVGRIITSDGNGSQSGGIIGRGGGPYTITNCFNAGNVDKGSGINESANNSGTIIENCYNIGQSISGGSGGINNSNATVRSVYNVGSGFNSGIGGSSNTSNCYNNSNKISAAGGGTNLTTAQMTDSDTLTNSSKMSGLGTTSWYKRPNESTTDQSKMYYPELAAFANHSWKALREYSKASVRVSGYVDPGYNNVINTAPTCTANTAVTDVPWIGNGTK